MKRLLILLLLYAPMVLAQGVPKDTSWTAPTQYINGDPLPDQEIIRYLLSCSNNGGATFDFYSASIPNAGGTISFTTDSVFTPGPYRCFITAWAQHPADTAERESDPSNQVVFFVGCDPAGCRPDAPTMLQMALVVGEDRRLSLTVVSNNPAIQIHQGDQAAAAVLRQG